MHLQLVCFCISAFDAETQPMEIEHTPYTVVCNKKVKSKMYVHRPNASKPKAQKQSNTPQKSIFVCVCV